MLSGKLKTAEAGLKEASKEYQEYSEYVGASKVKEYEKLHLNAQEHRGEALDIYTLASETRKQCYFLI